MVRTVSGVNKNMWRRRQSGLDAPIDRNFPVDSLSLCVPLWHPELSGSPFTSKDLNAHSCTVVGATWSSTRGRWFDGGGAADDLITVPAHASINNIFDSGGTVIVWIDIASEGEGTAGFLLYKDVGSVGWYLTVHGVAAGKVKLQFLQRYAAGGGSLYWDTDNTVVTINTPTMVAVTYTNTTASTPIIYVNEATPAITKSGTGSGARVDDSGADLIIGNNPTATRTTDGYIMEAWGYSRILTAAELSHIYKTTIWRYQ